MQLGRACAVLHVHGVALRTCAACTKYAWLAEAKRITHNCAVHAAPPRLARPPCPAYAGSVREYSCPSPGEENAALYNMACAYARMGQRSPALTCIEALLENEFEVRAVLLSFNQQTIKNEES